MTQTELKDILHYNQDTGVFLWLVSKGRMKAELVAGSPDGCGHLQIKINKKQYKAHRLAFLYMNGEMPSDEVDHINGCPSDNRWENLREVSRKENGENLKLSLKNSSGFRGVCFNKARNKFQADVIHFGKHHYLGLFDTAQEANEAVKIARSKLFTHDTGRSNG